MKKLIVAAFCLLANLAAAAQDSAAAEAALSKYAAATKAYDTAAMTALMHPDALKQFRTTINAALAGPKAEQARMELLPVFSVTTVAAYSALSDPEAYKRLTDSVGRGAPELVDMMTRSTYEIVGSVVKEGVAYVTYNLGVPVQGNPVKSQVVQTLRMHRGTWLLMLPPTADATIAGIQSRYQ